MAQDLTLKVAGLYTDLNPLQEIPNGALKVANNIQIRRRGTAERRPGFSVKQTVGPTDWIDRILPFEGSYSVLTASSLGTQRWSTAAGTVITIDGAWATYVLGESFGAEMQKRLYVTLEDFVARYEGAAVANRAGIEQPGQPWLTDLTQDQFEGWLSYGDQVGYRSVLRRTIDGQDVLSAPSAASYVSPTEDWGDLSIGNLPFFPTLRVNLPSRAAAGDQLQVYRTLTAESALNPVTPGDEMRMMASVSLAGADITAGYVDFADKSPDTALSGSALYTNATQQGVLLANFQPSRLGCLDTYSDMMFGGNVSTDQGLALQMPTAQGSGPFDYGTNDKIWPGRRIYTTPTCVITSGALAGTNAIAVSGWYGQDFAVGEWVSDKALSFVDTTGVYFTEGTEITSAVNSSPGVWDLQLNLAVKAFGGTHDEFDLFRPVRVHHTGITWAAGDVTLYGSSVYDSLVGTTIGKCYVTNAGAFTPNAPGSFTVGTVTTESSGSSDSFSLGVLTIVGLSSATTAGRSETGGVYLWHFGDPETIGGGASLTVVIGAAATSFTVGGTDAREMFAAGQYITDVDKFPGDAGTIFPANTKISSVSWASPTLTVNIDKTTGAAGNEFTVWDYIDIDGTEYFGAEKQIFDLFSSTKSNIYLYGQSVLWSFQQLAGLIGYSAADYNAQAYGGGNDPRSWTFGGSSAATSALTVKSTKPLAWDKNVDKDTGVTSATEEYLNRLVWSKVQEPDAWPIGYFADIGQASARILRVMATRESLFVFKEDGTWRVTGTSPETLRVDEYDRTLKLIHPNAVSRIDNNLMGWFVSGVMLVTDAQTANVSDNMIGEDLSAIREAPEGSPWSRDIDAFTVERDNQWHLVCGNGSGDPQALMYTFNLVTQAWVTWTIDYSDTEIVCGVDDEASARILLGGREGFDGRVFEERAPTDYQYDGQAYGVTPAAGTQLNGDLGSGYGFTIRFGASTTDLSVGDILTQGGVEYVAYEITDTSGGFPIEVAAWASVSTVPALAAMVGYPSIRASIEWTAKTEQNPGVRKYYREANLTFQHMDDTRVFDLKFSTDQVDDATINGTEFDDVGSRPYAMRALIPTNAGRSFWLNPRIDIPYVLADFRLDGCSLVYEWMSDRTGR